MKLLIFVSIPILLLYSPSVQSESEHGEHDVIIIGGGVAGLAAATKLAEKDVDYILLEAEPQIGGRIKSVHFGDSKVDVGAQWVHGEKGNIVYEIMKDTGLLHHSQDRYKIFPSDREDISEEFSVELFSIFMHIYANPEGKTKDETAGDHFIKIYKETIQNTYAKDEKKLQFAMQFLPTLERYMLSLKSAFNWQLPSAQNDLATCEGDMFLHWNGKGFYSVVEHLLKNLNITERVFTEKVVKKIELKPDGVVVNGKDFTYKGKYVIFTPSLGVLKNYHADLFDPPLGEDKVKAIEALGFGAIHKVWLHFPERWWPEENFTDFSLAWTWDDLYTLKTQFPKGPNRDGKSFLTNFGGLYGTPQNPKVLSAWFVGEFLPDIERMDDDLLVEGIMFALEKCIGHLYKIPKPDQVLRGKWYTNEHFHGTYTYQTVASRNMKPDAIKVLGEPIKTSDYHDRLLFAGEATNFEHHSTVHGAIETGYREADRVINALIADENK